MVQRPGAFPELHFIEPPPATGKCPDPTHGMYTAVPDIGKTCLIRLRSPFVKRSHVEPLDQTSPAGERSPVRRTWVLVERIAWVLGLGALGVWGAAHVASTIGARQDLKRFEALRTSNAEQTPPAERPAALPQVSRPDLALWDVKRVKAWQASLTRPAPAPLAVLRIPKIRLEVAVLPGTDDFVLDRAVGHIEDTPLPGSDGNSGIAGHRDGFFRGLKDIAEGDAIELQTLKGSERYRIERIWIVSPDDVSVLDPTPVRSLTLVTCYPFYFIGSAPQRLIVRAVREGSGTRMSKR